MELITHEMTTDHTLDALLLWRYYCNSITSIDILRQSKWLNMRMLAWMSWNQKRCRDPECSNCSWTKNTTIWRVYYSKQKFNALHKHTAFVFPEFLSSVGGVSSLFIEFSAIFSIELLYFMFCRPHLNFKRIAKPHHQVLDPEIWLGEFEKWTKEQK